MVLTFWTDRVIFVYSSVIGEDEMVFFDHDVAT